MGRVAGNVAFQAVRGVCVWRRHICKVRRGTENSLKRFFVNPQSTGFFFKYIFNLSKSAYNDILIISYF